MTQLGWDSFTRANNGSSWGTADDGQSWAELITISGASPTITSNEGQLTGFTAAIHMGLGSSTPNDLELLTRFEVSNIADVIGMFMRSQNNGTTFSEVRVTVSTSGTKLNVIRVLSGANTTLKQVTITTIVASTFYWIRFRAIGLTYWAKIWQDGTAEPASWNINAITDTQTLTGQFGIFSNPSATGDTQQFDHFYVVDYALLDAISLSDVSSPTVVQNTEDDSTTLETYSTPLLSSTSDPLTEIDGTITIVSQNTSDSSSLSEVNITSDVFVPSDQLSDTSSSSYGISESILETLSLSDISTTTDNPFMTDTLTLSEIKLTPLAFIPVDPLTEGETLSTSISESITENSSLSDVSTTTNQSNSTNSLTLSESETTPLTYVPTDQNTFVDATSFGESSSFSDGITTSDSMLPTNVFSPSETLTEIETQNITINENSIENSSLSDNSITINNPQLNDSVSVSDTKSITLSSSISDLLNEIELQLMGIAQNQTDTSSINDTFFDTEVFSQSDILTSSENTMSSLNISTSDTLSASESIIDTLSQLISDLISTLDASTETLSSSSTDGINTNDIIQININSILNEIASLGESLLVNLFDQDGDQLTLYDLSVIIWMPIAQPLIDQSNISDGGNFEIGFSSLENLYDINGVNIMQSNSVIETSSLSESSYDAIQYIPVDQNVNTETSSFLLPISLSELMSLFDTSIVTLNQNQNELLSSSDQMYFHVLVLSPALTISEQVGYTLLYVPVEILQDIDVSLESEMISFVADLIQTNDLISFVRNGNVPPIYFVSRDGKVTFTSRDGKVLFVTH